MSTIREITSAIPASNNIFSEIKQVRLQKLLPIARQILTRTHMNKSKKYGVPLNSLKAIVRQKGTYKTFIEPFGNDEMALEALNKVITELPGPNAVTKRRRRTSRKTRRNRRH